MNPYLIIAAGLFWLASVTGAYLKGGSDKEAHMTVAAQEARHQGFMEGRARQMASDRATRTVSDNFHTTNVAIIRQTNVIKEEIPIYVQDDATCITWGLVRVHDAFAFGSDPRLLDLPAGQSNDTCAGIGWRSLSETIGGNYGKFHETADQLTHLQTWVDAQLAVINSPALLSRP